MNLYFKIVQRFLLSSVLFLGLIGSGSVLAQEIPLSDSILKKFSVEELVKIRQLLAKQRGRLIRAQEKSRERGIDLSREFLGKSREENVNQDKILIRVAEYYIEEARLDFERKMEAFEKAYDEYELQLGAYNLGKLKKEPIVPEMPQKNFEKPIAIYDLIIHNFPESDLVDDAYYGKAYLLSEMGEETAARHVFQTIIDQFPESRYAPEAYMKLAESYFYPEEGDSKETTILKLNKAIQLYKNVLQYRESPRYLEALYKLGWSYYRLAGEDPDYYTDAIIYFLGVVRDIEKSKALDPTGKIVRTDVKPEALDFIAASFIDTAYSKSGVQNARTFLEKLGKPSYGVNILSNMGDRYAKITLWHNAIRAYRELLNMYPDYAYAPRIQKKISDAYIADGQFRRAFKERELLFNKYNPRSEWYSELEQRDAPDRIAALDEAYRMTEEALRTNIYYYYNLAERTAKDSIEQARSYYESFAELARQYLDYFPTDENAYEINWALAFILDTKLNRFEEAFNEYLRVSNDYLEDEHRLDAAVNAITVADTLVELTRAQRDTTVLTSVEFSKLPPQELSHEEKMLAEAYDNFIKLFPESAETPSVLADAGALYYNHRQFTLAKKYYKTMVTKFPEAQQKSIGLISLMNSYFFLGQYRDAEIVAKKIVQTQEIPPEQLEIARKRIGESIYKNGEKLEQQGLYREAAQEYLRVYQEAKEIVDFEDIALFKSANNFEKAGEWQQAIRTYELLIENYPESKHVLAALGNIAEDYKELEDFVNVGRSLERIFHTFPGTKDAELALYNSGIFYEKAQAWEDAIRANNLYISTYPKNPESKDLLFENAKYYLKLDDITRANRIYQSFAQMYPQDPRTVEAFYQRGNYYFERGRYDSAKVEFNRAISRSEEFARTGRDPNLVFAAKAYYKLGEILYVEYEAIKLTYPPQVLRDRLLEKRSKLQEVQKAFAKVIELGSLQSFEAMYRIAEAYEELANTISNQTLSPDLTQEQLLVERNKVFQASVPAYERAVEEYKNVVINIPLLAEKLGITLFDTTRKAPELTVTDTTKIYRTRVELDSSRQVAEKWYNRARDKISLIQYTVAEKSAEFITEYLRSPNPFTGLRALAFRDRLLKQLVLPAVQTTISSHLKNIKVSKELGLTNKYVIESKRKVLLTNNVIADQYAELLGKVFELYTNSITVLEDLVERGESATTPDRMDFYEYQDNYIMQLIFFLNVFSKTAIGAYENTLKFATEHNIENDAKLTTEERLFNFAFETGDRMDRLANVVSEKSEYFLEKFDSTELPNYQLGSTFFDDQSIELKNNSLEVLDVAFNISETYQIQNIWTRLILAKLVELDPSKYLTNLPKEEFIITSDTTWLATTEYEPGWNLADFSTEGWENAVKVDLPASLVFPVFDSLSISPEAIWVKRFIAPQTGTKTVSPGLELEEKEVPETDTTRQEVEDTTLIGLEERAVTATIDTQKVVGEPDTITAYFRKNFDLSAKPIDGWIAITGDKIYRLYLNDVYIIGVDNIGYENVRLIPFEALNETIKSGSNQIAVSVMDTDGAPRYGLRFYMNLKLLPTSISDVVARIRNVQQEIVDPEKFRKMVILNKNRIIKQ